jgi:hypothetical protein
VPRAASSIQPLRAATLRALKKKPPSNISSSYKQTVSRCRHDTQAVRQLACNQQTVTQDADLNKMTVLARFAYLTPVLPHSVLNSIAMTNTSMLMGQLFSV